MPDEVLDLLDIDVRGVTIKYSDFIAVDNIDLGVNSGEFLCLLGPSGCGKSTLLSALAGFIQVSNGSISYNAARDSLEADIGFIFQDSSALFEWLTVAQNVAFGARMRGVRRAKRQADARPFIDLVGLSGNEDRYPSELSGGMRQRLQIARVLANNPKTVLMDEPFGALDAQTREVMQRELGRIWRTQKCTIVFVTHDIDEALLLADRIAIMTAGPGASIKSVHTVHMPRPRSRTSKEFSEMYSVLREEIAVEVRKALSGQGLDQDIA